MTELYATLLRDSGHGTIELRRTYAATTAELWQAITDPVRLARWMAPVDGNLVEGGDYRIIFDDTDPGQRSWGRIEVCRPEEELRVTWQSPGDEAASTVHVTLTAGESGTELRIVHAGLTHGSDVGYTAGWEIYAHRLAADVGDTSGGEVPDWETGWPLLRDAHLERIQTVSDS